jgi:hypothetical protein
MGERMTLTIKGMKEGAGIGISSHSRKLAWI